MNLLTRIKHAYWRHTLKNRSVTIISNNCWGSFMSQYCGLPYHSPLVGCFLFAPDYIRLLQSLRLYMQSELQFIPREQSRYAAHVTKEYPIGLLSIPGESAPVEIHFLHYTLPTEAADGWRRRVGRIDYNNMLVKFCDRDLCTPELIETFDQLDFRSKVCFTAKPYPFASVVQMKHQSGRTCVNAEWESSDRYYNFVREANNLQLR